MNFLKSLSLTIFLHTFHSVADSKARAKMDTNCEHRCQTQEYLKKIIKINCPPNTGFYNSNLPV